MNVLKSYTFLKPCFKIITEKTTNTGVYKFIYSDLDELYLHFLKRKPPMYFFQSTTFHFCIETISL